MKKYITTTKSDDYGACITELVETTEQLAKEYYWNKEVEELDATILEKYLGLIGYEEEKERSTERRFYGTD